MSYNSKSGLELVRIQSSIDDKIYQAHEIKRVWETLEFLMKYKTVVDSKIILKAREWIFQKFWTGDAKLKKNLHIVDCNGERTNYEIPRCVFCEEGENSLGHIMNNCTGGWNVWWHTMREYIKEVMIYELENRDRPLAAGDTLPQISMLDNYESRPYCLGVSSPS
eukprot:Nk52_evm1s570 gene=Nk52_evmTU1s570